ncbi:hypothetical protein PsYK624_149820 [Phanerochaete sordida]|uniref:Uncharacterized protein n=1 Tax=Phanerochaete sordida TaxID=48140 RepID=A0A9P3GPZ7_9APHY|nr:hypothetical protein PsYK624_149820 [Phanerochaete sordida]
MWTGWLVCARLAIPPLEKGPAPSQNCRLRTPVARVRRFQRSLCALDARDSVKRKLILRPLSKAASEVLVGSFQPCPFNKDLPCNCEVQHIYIQRPDCSTLSCTRKPVHHNLQSLCHCLPHRETDP